MTMRQSIRMGRIGGIEIGLHWSVQVAGALMAYALFRVALPAADPGRPALAYARAAVETTVLVLMCLILHELAHVWVARRLGIAVRRITLLPLGGVRELAGGACRTRAQLLVAAAGPAANLLQSGAAEVAVLLAKTLGLPALTVASLTWLSAANILIAVVNLFRAGIGRLTRTHRTVYRDNAEDDQCSSTDHLPH
jgi:Zn-dependent protease